ncbi:MAG: hypothetical protein KDA60_04900 [Planctomycetales bacterium]|nr:hypothetical protein [Planctomycetales bacterium]
MRKSRRIICYAINGSGLGHLTRLLAVARWMRRYVTVLDHRRPEILFLTSSEASDLLTEAGFAAFKIPSKTIVGQAGLDKLEYRRLAKHFIWHMLGTFGPDLFVVDTFPAGSFDELFQVLDGPFAKSFIYRHVKPEYASRPTFQAALRMYDTVVSPHRVPAEQSPGSGQSMICYSGEVVQFERDELLPAAEARAELGIGAAERVVYVSAGGGGDPQAAESLRSLVETCCQMPQVHVLVGAGPLYRGPRLRHSQLTWYSGPRVWKYFSACDVAISAGGYNTFHELVYARVPSLFYAQDKIADDQRQRIDNMVAAGACRRLHDVLDREEIGREVLALLEPDVAGPLRAACAQVMPQNEASRCALELIRPLYEAAELEWAQCLLTPRLAHSLERMAPDDPGLLSQWLNPLGALFDKTALPTQPVMEALMRRLSPEAAQEVQVALDTDPSLQDRRDFEDAFVALCDEVTTLQGRTGGESLQHDVLKTLLSTIKRHARQTAGVQWLPELTSHLTVVRRLLKIDVAGISCVELLQMYRVFPKIVDIDCDETQLLFQQYVELRGRAGDSPHQMMREFQILKMTQPQVTRSIFERHITGFAS